MWRPEKTPGNSNTTLVKVKYEIVKIEKGQYKEYSNTTLVKVKFY